MVHRVSNREPGLRPQKNGCVPIGEVQVHEQRGPRVRPSQLARHVDGRRGGADAALRAEDRDDLAFLVRLASSWISRMRAVTRSSVAAICWCIAAGSSPSTKYGSCP